MSLSLTLLDSWYRVLPLIGGIGGPYMACDLLMSPTVTGQFLIKLFFTTLTNLSFAMWLVFRFRTTASSAFRTSLARYILLLPSTVDNKKLKALLSLEMFMLLASSAYSLLETRLNLNSSLRDV